MIAPATRLIALLSAQGLSFLIIMTLQRETHWIAIVDDDESVRALSTIYCNRLV